MIEQPAASAAATFFHRLRHREIPRSERRNRTNRLEARQHVRIGGSTRDDLTEASLALLGKPLDCVRGSFDFGPRLSDRLALLPRQQRGDGVSAFAQQGGGTTQNAGAIERHHTTPARESDRSGPDSQFEIGVARHGDASYRLFCSGIDDCEAATFTTGTPHSVDQKAHIQ